MRGMTMCAYRTRTCTLLPKSLLLSIHRVQRNHTLWDWRQRASSTLSISNAVVSRPRSHGEPEFSSPLRCAECTRVGMTKFCLIFERDKLPENTDDWGDTFDAWRANPDTHGKVATYWDADDLRISFTEQSRRLVRGKLFCLLEGGYYGMVPKAARVGDFACAMVGASVPLLWGR